MSDIPSSFGHYFRDKASNPILPAFVIAWILINYPITLIVFDGADAVAKIKAIHSYLRPDGAFNFQRGFLYPAYSALFYSFIFPLMTGGVVVYQEWINKLKTDLQLIAIKKNCGPAGKA